MRIDTCLLGLLGQGCPVETVPIRLGLCVGGISPVEAQIGHDVGPFSAVGGDIGGIGHVGAFHGVQREVRDQVDRGDIIAVNQSGGFGVAGEAVELFCPVSLYLGRTEPVGKGLDSSGLFLGAAGFVKDANILGNVIGTVGNVNQSPVLRLKSTNQRMLGSVSGSVNLAVEGGGIEFRDRDVTLVQRVESVLVVIATGLAVRTELPKSLPAIDGNTAGRRGRRKALQS